MGRVCSELLRAAQNLFLSPTACAAGCFTVNVQSLLDGARLERTDSHSNEHEGETLVLFDFTPQHCWNGDASCAACLSCLTLEPARAWIQKHWCSTCACSEWCWVPGLDLCREHAAAPQQLSASYCVRAAPHTNRQEVSCHEPKQASLREKTSAAFRIRSGRVWDCQHEPH